MYINKRLFVLLVILNLQAVILPGQCPDEVIFYKGLFYPMISTNNTFSVSNKGYPAYDALGKTSILSASSSGHYRVHVYSSDSIGICAAPILRFSVGGKWAVFSGGRSLTDFIYDYAYAYVAKDKKAFCLVRNQDRLGLLNSDGKLATAIEFGLTQFNEIKKGDSVLVTCCREFKKEVEPDVCDDCSNGTYYYPLGSNCIPLSKSGKCGALDSLGKTIIPFLYDTIFVSVNYGNLGNRNGKRYFITYKGEELSQFDDVKPVIIKQKDYPVKGFSGVYFVKKNNLWGLVNSHTGERTKCEFQIDSSDEYYEGLFPDIYTQNLWKEKKLFLLEITQDKITIKDVKENDISKMFLSTPKK